jgi:glutathione S-transferase
MANLTLYHATPSRSAVALWMLEEVGAFYDIKQLNLQNGDQLKPDYLAINPMGKVPALKDGDAIITESAAICTYLADAFPQAKLNIPIGDPQRGVYLKWLFFGPSVFEPAMTDRAFPRKETPNAAALGYRDFDKVQEILAKAVGKGPFLMGEQFTAADVVIGSGLRYGTMFKLIPERKEFTDYIARFASRTAALRAQEKDKELGAKTG